jgi:Tfp pilus assembly protein PilV
MRSLIACLVLGVLVLAAVGCACQTTQGSSAPGWRAEKRARYADLWVRHLSSRP